MFWTIAWPLIWVLIDSFLFTRKVPESAVSQVRASITISMITFALTIAGMANLPANIARDRETGLLAKLKSMPVTPWKDILGRLFALAVFSAIASGLVVIAGFFCGARFSGSFNNIIHSSFFLLVALLASAGIGLLIGAFIRSVQGVIMGGVGLCVVMASITGLFSPYASLPPVLQKLSRVYPVSSANSIGVYLLAGKDISGYNPLSQTLTTIVFALLLFFAGLLLYYRVFWRGE
ncbi:ABC transporter permease [Thermococcus sp.]